MNQLTNRPVTALRSLARRAVFAATNLALLFSSPGCCPTPGAGQAALKDHECCTVAESEHACLTAAKE